MDGGIYLTLNNKMAIYAWFKELTSNLLVQCWYI